MSDLALGVLVLIVCVLVGGALLGYSILRVVGRDHGTQGAALEALETGAVSLFVSDPRTNLTPATTSPALIRGERAVARSRAARVLDAFASGGVSIFAEPPGTGVDSTRAGTDDRGPEAPA
jgi:hypothetical protein